ncbi:glycosyltransferase [uncultured Polaribacter sp.]|uniref:glycosyltransferase n=1 Tax=uncultured Polaribacter sp. TaxID=174711 RepID=UPI0026284A2D|nr:glycosyltransferase [uncultured Polaribacter sp.]
MKIANVIVSEQSIPSHKNGSWTQRIEYYLKSASNNVDYVICSETKKTIKSSSKFYNSKNKNSRFERKFFPKKRYSDFLLKISLILENYDKIILCVIDNIKLSNAVSDYLDINSLKDKVTLIFYSCGYSYFLKPREHLKFSKNIDEIIFLTKSAYHFNKDIYNEFTPEVSIINNPINKNIFSAIKRGGDDEISKKYNLKGKTVFLWLSHDRKKKGLSIILNAWKIFNKENSVLLVVGAKRDLQIPNVIFVGQVESFNVHKYYKCAHIYLFPTLWKEGFGLSLSQAICSGCFSVAAKNGGVEDFFTKSDGILIEEPNLTENWINAMEIARIQIQKGWKNESLGKQILTFDEWSLKFSEIFNKWQKRLKI